MAKRVSYEQLLVSLYRSVSTPGALIEFLEEISHATHSHLGCVLMHDFISGTGSLPALIGAPSDAILAYEKQFSAENIWMQRLAHLLHVGHCGTSDSYVSLGELRTTIFWREYLSLVDVDHAIGITGAFDMENAAQLTLCRSHRVGQYGEKEMQLGRAIAPHWANACQIRRQLGTLHDTVTSLEAALNRVALAVLFVDGTGIVCRTNHGAERMLSAGDVITLHRRRLTARTAADTHHLGQAVAKAIRSATSSDTPPPEASRLMLHDAQGVPVAFASIRPLVTIGAMPASSAQPAALVFIRNLSAESREDLGEALVELFAFTPAEARLVIELYKTTDLAAASDNVAISIDAARSRLKIVFDKTGMHNQAALVRMIGELKAVLG